MISNLIKNIGRNSFVKERILSEKCKLVVWNNNNNKMGFSQSSIQHVATESFSEQSNTQEQPYTERAYTPSEMSSQLLTELSHKKQSSPEQILHQLSLYYNKLLPFDYDYFTESLRRLIHYQEKLSMEEILMLFDLAIEYKIDSLVLERQFMNEVYCRVYMGLKKELLEYDCKIKEQLSKTYKHLESMSKDHFEIISEEFKDLMEEEQENEDNVQNKIDENNKIENNNQINQKAIKKSTLEQHQKEENRPIHNSSLRKNKSKKLTPEILNRITKIFVDLNSKNIDFNKVLLEIHTTRLDETHALVDKKPKDQANETPLTPESLLLYTRLTVNLLQLYMTEYQSTLATTKNKEHKYTHRSVKNIYKLQHFYYYEVAKMVEDQKLLEKATNEQLLEFAHVLSAFPIKRRSFRKTVGEIMIEEFKKREIKVENMMRFFELSKYDNKLLQHFENKINHGKQLLLNEQSVQKINQSKEELEIQPNIEDILSAGLKVNTMIESDLPSSPINSEIFKMPLTLFKKVTKKKSKSKNKNMEESVEIDLTQPDSEIDVENSNESNLNKIEEEVLK